MKIGTRLALSFGVVLLLLMALAALGLDRLAATQDRMRDIVRVNGKEQQEAIAMRAAALEHAIVVRNLVILTDQAEMRQEADRLAPLHSTFNNAYEALGKLFASQSGTTAKERSLYESVGRQATALAPLLDKSAQLGLANKADEATKVLLTEVRPVQAALLKDLGEISEFEATLNRDEFAAAEKDYESARALLIAIAATALVLGAAMAWFTTRSVTRPLRDAVSVADAVASGDLTVTVHADHKDETGQLLRAMGKMTESLAGLVGRVRASADSISTASGQIASGNQDLSQRTEEQASSLEETAASMEELTGTVKQNAENARQANQLAHSATEVAGKGGAVVAQVVETMSEINRSSTKIAEIISVIDGIAFQTNILALNAAVEAARAGEQGRGFAVVAAEVRSLAQRSAAAAKEIKGLIDDSVGKVGAGTELVGRAGETMQEIVTSVGRVSGIMGEIAAASQEQTRGIEQVNQAVVQMDQVTQQNAALVEEAAAAAQSMRDQANQLVEDVSAFRVAVSTQRAVKSTYERRARPMPTGAQVRAARTPQPATALASAESPSARPALTASADDDWKEF